MHNLNDDEFETYLKSFVPVDPIALPQAKNSWHHSGKLRITLGTIAAAGVILVAEIGLTHTRPERRIQPKPPQAVSKGDAKSLPPLTVGSANRWLVSASSMDAALDHLAFTSKDIPTPAKSKSAIATLRQESTKL